MFNIGDKVRIIRNLSVEKNNAAVEMLKYAGKECEIYDVCGNFYLLDIDNGEFAWDCDYLEKVEDNLKHQEVKADAGKLQMMLMLPAINRAVVRVREYGILKYKDKDNWKKINRSRWENALIRHLMEYIKDPYSKDEESGLRHIDHIACNLAYILENMEGEGDGK